jgi:hypothetical protein
MTYDILFQLRGDEHAARHFKTVKDSGQALKIVHELKNFPADTINIVVTSEDGSVVYTTEGR